MCFGKLCSGFNWMTLILVKSINSEFSLGWSVILTMLILSHNLVWLSIKVPVQHVLGVFVFIFFFASSIVLSRQGFFKAFRFPVTPLAQPHYTINSLDLMRFVEWFWWICGRVFVNWRMGFNSVSSSGHHHYNCIKRVPILPVYVNGFKFSLN